MAKVKVMAATVSNTGNPIVFDDKGRVWVLGLDLVWSRMPDLPEEPTK